MTFIIAHQDTWDDSFVFNMQVKYIPEDISGKCHVFTY